MPSFDIVSTIDLAEVTNAVTQASKEIIQRFDFKGSNTKIVREDKLMTIESSDEFKVKASWDVLQSKLVKRNVSLKSIKPQKIESASGGRARQKFDLISGIDEQNAKEIVKTIKNTKLKVQASIQGDVVRINGKKKDDLQEVITFMKTQNFSLPLQFINFRD